MKTIEMTKLWINLPSNHLKPQMYDSVSFSRTCCTVFYTDHWPIKLLVSHFLSHPIKLIVSCFLSWQIKLSISCFSVQSNYLFSVFDPINQASTSLFFFPPILLLLCSLLSQSNKLLPSCIFCPDQSNIQFRQTGCIGTPFKTHYRRYQL